MPAIQKLYNACKVSLSPNGPVSEEAVEKVRTLLGSVDKLPLITSYLRFLISEVDPCACFYEYRT